MFDDVKSRVRGDDAIRPHLHERSCHESDATSCLRELSTVTLNK